MANAVITVKEADGVTETDVTVLDVGRQAAAASKSTTMSTEDKAVLDAIATSLALLDNSIASGNELQVDIVGSIPAGNANIGDVDIASIAAGDNNIGNVDIASIAAGTNAIGKLAANSGVDIGDVDVTSVPTDPFGANADAASATGSISAKLRAIATALGVTAFDLGPGTGGTRTLRVALDTAQMSGAEYETVAASQTAQVLGATGATGNLINGILVIPATTSPGNVLLLDNATSITVFAGGASSVSNLVPFFIPLGIISVSGAWKITTGANVSCIGIGEFT
jgi:hypothetical protein